ncbi:hypothetical protein CTA1_9414 [Colletotrichum tanaceti]|uniref:Uncharacterized protein n=1 Tax=Colletotrichum tanaceti TaxID=1306861 RepID=A0A4U6XLQ8_9PEZI|nr:hypothetical protein CTA1_9414 [Colletotrichum tanaceti]
MSRGSGDARTRRTAAAVAGGRCCWRPSSGRWDDDEDDEDDDLVACSSADCHDHQPLVGQTDPRKDSCIRPWTRRCCVKGVSSSQMQQETPAYTQPWPR